MKNEKVLITMVSTISILLTITIIGFILNIVGTYTLKTAKNKNENIEQHEMADVNINENIEDSKEQDEDVTNEENIINFTNITEARTAAVNGSSIISTVSSRSEVNRQMANNSETIYVNVNENSKQTSQEEYEEIIEYIKLEDVKISFDMDVSKTTGLSQEDFVYLVQNMKCDKTGILEKNAAWIWECCQKYSVNEIFVLGICGIESAWCSAPQHQNTHNYSSLMKGGKLISYASDEAGFEAMIKLLGQKYLSPKGSLYHGATITGVGTCYCNTTTWPNKVYTCMQKVFK